MKRFKIIKMLLIVCSLLSLVSCTSNQEVINGNKLEISTMEEICELAVMDCYFHNVAKYTEEDASGALWWTKDKKFWVEYSGIVSIGLDASLISLEVDGENITVTLPKSKVLSSKVDEKTLTKDSFFVDKNSAKIDANDQTTAFSEAQTKMINTAKSDSILLAESDRRAKVLLKDYIENIGELVGVEYNINWITLESQDEEDDDSENNTSEDDANSQKIE